MRRKLLAVLIAAMIALGAMPVALAAEGDLTVFSIEADDTKAYYKSIVSMTSDGEKLYLLAGEQILTYSAGDAQPVPYITGITSERMQYEMREPDYEHLIGAIFWQNDHLLCLNTTLGTVFTLSADENGAPVYGEVTALGFDEEMLETAQETHYLEFQFEEIVLFEDALLVSGYTYFGGSGELELYRFPLDGSEYEVIEDIGAANMYGLAPYKDGKLLYIGGEWEEFYKDGEYIDWPLKTLDVNSGETEELYTMPASLRSSAVKQLVYDDVSDMIYLVQNNRIFGVSNQGKAELVAYHPASSMYEGYNNAAMLGGQIALYDTYGMYLRTPDPAQLTGGTLAISGYYDTDAHKKAAAQMDDVPIFFENDAYFNSAQELGQALTAGEKQLDLISVSADWIELDRLMEKGYCYDLSGSKILTDWVNSLYPFLRDTLIKDGKLYAIPVEVYNYDTWGCNPEALEKLGYQAPKTFADVARIANDFAKDGNEEVWETYCLSNDETDFKESLFRAAMETYEQYQLSRGEALNLDTKEFRTMMEAIGALDVKNVALDAATLWTDEGEPSEEVMELWEKEALFESYSNVDLRGDRDYGDKMIQMELCISEEAEYILPMSVQVIFINPRSENVEAAIRYLELLVSSWDYEFMARQSPNYTEAIENANYEDTLSSLDQNIADLEKQIESAEPIDRPALEENLLAFKENREDYALNNRYQVTEKGIMLYQEKMEHAVTRYKSALYADGDNSFSSLMKRYQDGQIELEQFIREGGSKLRLQQLENQ